MFSTSPAQDVDGCASPPDPAGDSVHRVLEEFVRLPNVVHRIFIQSFTDSQMSDQQVNPTQGTFTFLSG